MSETPLKVICNRINYALGWIFLENLMEINAEVWAEGYQQKWKLKNKIFNTVAMATGGGRYSLNIN